MENDSQKVKTSERTSQICPICTTSAVFFTAKNMHRLYRCPFCGLIFVWPLPADTSGIYSSDYFRGAKGGFGYVDYDQDKAAMTSTFEVYLDSLETLFPRKGRLLDVGAASGYFVEMAYKRGWGSYGVEISDYAASLGRGKNLNITTGTLKDVPFGPDFFDAVTLWDVIEHITDPRTELKRIHNILKSGGVLAINTPDTSSFWARIWGRRWHLLVPPEHLIYFNPANISRLLRENGFDVLSIRKIGKKFTLQYVALVLSHWRDTFIWRWAANILKKSFLGKLAISVNLRDNFFIIARKS